jgi:hypothetical protein
MFRHGFTLASALFLLAACTPAATPQAAMERASREFAGHDVTEFFISYGSPVSSQAQGDGKTYRWVSIEPSGGPRSAGIITYPGGHFGTMGSNGEMVSGYCEISIRTDSQERIQKLTLVYDSVGKFSSSRCAEIFGAPPP